MWKEQQREQEEREVSREGPGGKIKRLEQSRLKGKYIGERVASTSLIWRLFDTTLGTLERLENFKCRAQTFDIDDFDTWWLTFNDWESIRKWTSSLTLELRGSKFYQTEWDSTTERTPKQYLLIFIAFATEESLSGSNENSKRRKSFLRISLAAVAVVAAAVAVRGSCTLLAWCASSSSLFVRVGARSYVTEGNRSAAESLEAARHGTAAEDITITYLAALPLHSRLGVRRTRTCARARVCVRVSVLLRECVRRVLSRVCPVACVSSAPERAAGGEEERVSVNGSRQDYAKPRKYEHCCPTAGRRVHWTKGKRWVFFALLISLARACALSLFHIWFNLNFICFLLIAWCRHLDDYNRSYRAGEYSV